MALKILGLDGLNDAKLCKLVSTLLESIQGVDYANIDYLSQRLTLQVSGSDNAKTIAKVVLTIKENMPTVTVRFADVEKPTNEVKPPPPPPNQRASPDFIAPAGNRDVGSPTNVAKTISSMMKEDTAELERKRAREKENAEEASAKEKTAELKEAKEAKEANPLAELAPQAAHLMEQGNPQQEGRTIIPPEELPEGLSDEYVWEAVEAERVPSAEENGEAVLATAEEIPPAEKVPFFDIVRRYMSTDVFWQLCGMGGGFLAMLIGICFPTDNAANYAFTVVAFIILAIFALLVDTGENRAIQVTASIITVFGCAALFFTGGSRPAACMGLFFYHMSVVGVYFLQRSYKEKLENVIAIKPKTLIRARGDIMETIPFAEVLPTDEVVIAQGQCIPFDGIVVHGEGKVEESFLNGKKELRDVSEGSQVECGTYNMGEPIRIVMISLPENTAAGIVRKAIIADNPSNCKITQQVKRFQLVAVLAQLALSVGALLLFLLSKEYEKCIEFLPIVLILLSPSGISSAVERIQTGLLARAVKNGIIITSSSRFDEIMKIKTVAMACSGVLTDGAPVVDSVAIAEEQFPEDVARAAAYAEYGVDHTIARAVVEYYTSTYNKPVVPSGVSSTENMLGGVRTITDFGMILAGGERLMRAGRISAPPNDIGVLSVYVAKYSDYIGKLIMREHFNEGFAGIGSALRGAGAEKVVLVTGRDNNVAKAIGKRGSFDKVSAEHTNESKRDQLLLLSKERGTAEQVAYVGLVEDAALVLDFCPCIVMGEGAIVAMLNSAKAIIPVASPKKLAMLFGLAKLSQKSSNVLSIATLILNMAVLLLAALGTFSFWGVAIFILLLNLSQAAYGYLHAGD